MSDSNGSDNERNNVVRYGRPPVSGQFKPGQSGNPKGRPKGQKNSATMLADALNRKIKVHDKNGRTQTLTMQQVMIESMVNKAAQSGDPKLVEKVLQLADKLGVFKQQAAESSDAFQTRLREF